MKHWYLYIIIIGIGIILNLSYVNYCFAQSDTIYIDPENKADHYQDGSLNHPFNSWQKVEWNYGITYLQKSGTTSSESELIITANNVKISSYGEGRKPVIKSNSNNAIFHVNNKKGIEIKNYRLITEDAESIIFFNGDLCDDITIENCEIVRAKYGIRINNGNNYEIKYNSFSNTKIAIYSNSKSVKILYNIFKTNLEGIRFGNSSENAIIENNVFYDNETSIVNKYSSLQLVNNIFYLSSEKHGTIITDEVDLLSEKNMFYPKEDGFILLDSTKYTDLKEFKDQSQKLQEFQDFNLLHPETKGLLKLDQEGFEEININKRSPFFDVEKIIKDEKLISNYYGELGNNFNFLPLENVSDSIYYFNIKEFEKKLKKATIIYNSPKKIRYGDSQRIVLFLSYSLNLDSLKKQYYDCFSSDIEIGQVFIDTIYCSRYMHSDLNVIDFQKMLIGSNLKFTLQDNINRWEWNIKPYNKGKYSLCLNISPVVFIGDNLESHFNVVNCHEIEVVYGFSKRFWDFINSAFFVAIFASLTTGFLTYKITYYKKKAERKKKA